MSLRISSVATFCVALLLCSAAHIPSLPQPGQHLAIGRRGVSSLHCSNVTTQHPAIVGAGACISLNPEPSLDDCQSWRSAYFLTGACYTKLNISDFVASQKCERGADFAKCLLQKISPSHLPCLNTTNNTVQASWNCVMPGSNLLEYSPQSYYVVDTIYLIATLFAYWQYNMHFLSSIRDKPKFPKSNTYNKNLLSLTMLGELTVQPLDPEDLHFPADPNGAEKQRLMAWVIRQAIAEIPDFGKILCASSYSPTDTVKGTDINGTLPLIFADAFDKIQNAFYAIINTPEAFLSFPVVSSERHPLMIRDFGLDVVNLATNLTAYLTSSGKQKLHIEQTLYSSSSCVNVEH